MIQLPNDAVSMGYKLVRPFEYAQVFSSKTANFIGTEAEFVSNGFGYCYTQFDEFTRNCLFGDNHANHCNRA